jgi:phosphotriesterase-related protein
MLADETGMHLITNTGYYGARNNHFLPVAFYEMSAEELATLWIGEFEHGIEESGVKPGFIKIAVDAHDSLSAEHRKIITAAALTHQQTGLVIASHTGPDQPAFEQLEVLGSFGIDPSAFIWVHAQRGTLEGNIRAARSGCWISLDNINAQKKVAPQEKYSIDWYAERMSYLKEEGLLDKVLISHDAGWYSPGQEGGGNYRGYTGLFTHLIPELKKRNFTSDDLDQLLIENPRKAFAI